MRGMDHKESAQELLEAMRIYHNYIGVHLHICIIQTCINLNRSDNHVWVYEDAACPNRPKGYRKRIAN